MSGSNEKSLSEEAKTRMVEKCAKSKVLSKSRFVFNKHFSEAIKEKQKEVEEINEAIIDAQTILHSLRYGAVSKTYSAFKASSTSHDSLHPEIKSFVAGKRPKSAELKAETAEVEDKKEEVYQEPVAEAVNAADLPGYVAPLDKKNDSTCTMAEPRGHQHKFKRRFVIGNVSKWIECDEREDSSTHKWMLYVRGCKDFPDISDVVKKVRFFIHQTYHPNNVIDVTHPPYHLIRRGWGEFPARVQIHFKNPANKPVDVVHNLKLDKTYTGLQTLGSETLIDAWLKKDAEVKQESKDVHLQQVEQNYTIVEDKTSDNSFPLKRSASNNGEGDCKRAKLSLDSPKNILKSKEVKSLLRPGSSLLKKFS